MPNKYNKNIKEEARDSRELESMDRKESPKMWSLHDTEEYAQPAWMNMMTQDDINAMCQLGALSKNGLLAEISKIFDQAYSIGLQEAKELTKGRSLDIFSNPSRRK